MSGGKPGTGWYRLGSAAIWGGAQGAMAHYVSGGSTLGAAFGGALAGWCTASLVGRFAKWGAGARLLMILGAVVGIAVASGAVTGLSQLFDWWRTKELKVDWASLGRFFTNGAFAPAALLGLVTGLYVRWKIPRPETKE